MTVAGGALTAMLRSEDAVGHDSAMTAAIDRLASEGAMATGAGTSWVVGLPVRSYSINEAPTHFGPQLYFEPPTSWELLGGCPKMGSSGATWYVTVKAVTSPW